MSQSGPAPKRARHLLDPSDLHAHHQRSQGTMESLTRVQTWVVSILVVSTILHLAAGAVFIAYFAPADRLDARVGANVIASLIGVAAVATGLLIHRRSPVSPWLALGLLPGVIGAVVTFA